VKSPNQWRAASIDETQVREFRANLERFRIRAAFAHASYLPNLASPDRTLRRRSVASIVLELERCEALGLPFLVFHPGSHMGRGEKRGLERAARSMREALARTEGSRVALVPETTAGQGTNLGGRLDHLGFLLEAVAREERTGVCLDTCHLFAAGYDLRDGAAVRATLKEVERYVGIRRIRAVHLNDSERGLGSRVDRHAHIGRGKIGREGFRCLLADRRLRRVPMVLETPKGARDEMDRKNLGLLRRLVGCDAPRGTDRGGEA